MHLINFVKNFYLDLKIGGQYDRKAATAAAAAAAAAATTTTTKYEF